MFQAFDIETTGLTANDKVTVLGFATADEYEIHMNMDDGRMKSIEDSFDWSDGEAEIVFHEHDSERTLLSELSQVVARRDLKVEEQMVVGYSSSNFDFPFLRTRCVQHGIPWAFSGVNHLDLRNAYKYDWNTTVMDVGGFNKTPLKEFGNAIGAPIKSGMYKNELHEAIEEHGYTVEQLKQFADAQGKEIPTSSAGDMDGVYDLLVGEDVPDPFESSKEAVTAWSDGEIDPIVRHNLADLKKTFGLVSVVHDYVPQQSLRVDKL